MTATSSKENISFIPRERGSLPRILLLDFDDSYREFLEDENYSVYLGGSGFSDVPLYMPIHQSEIEIIFWDAGNLSEDRQITTQSGHHNYSYNQGKLYMTAFYDLKRYFSRVKGKGGFVGVFLGDVINEPLNSLSDLLGRNFAFHKRNTATIDLHQHEDDDVWYEFYRRFNREENIRFSIEWSDNLVNFVSYFEDEDSNVFAVSYDYFAIIPKIEDKKKKEALKFLLQDVLPVFCAGQDIFPSKYYYLWTNRNIYLPSKVDELRKQKVAIEKQYEEQIKKIRDDIAAEIENSEYMSIMLIADDSNLFPDEKKLSSSVHKILEDDLRFNVTDVDKMRLNVGQSLKEDKWLEDDEGFFALVEIKGTDRGAKANWVKQDLNAHIREFEVVKGITGLNSILIFNHERRVEPESRTEPFSSDSDLIEYCKKAHICLLPVYELFKMARDVKEGLLSAGEARSAIKNCKGMFGYKALRKY